MNYNELKEIRKHGDDMMPIRNYDYFAPLGINPMHCHWHDEMELFKLVKGKLKIQCGDKFFFAVPGSLMFFNSGEIHAAEPTTDEPIDFRSIVFHPDMLCDRDLIRAKYITPVLKGRMILPTDLSYDSEIVGTFDRLFGVLDVKEFGYELEVKSLLFHIFARLSKNVKIEEVPVHTSASAQSIKKVIEFINDNYPTPITIEQLSAISNMSQGHFCRLFKQITLKTPVQYINNVRISKAVELLISSDRKVLDIALDTGFNSLSYFIGVFKESVGITPTKFRREYGNRK